MSLERPKVLFVDDELDLLEPVSRLLRRRYDVVTAGDALSALAQVDLEPNFSVALVDLELPGMNGIGLLEELQSRSPLTVRMLITGRAQLKSAIAAVNQGHVYRMLQKPCPPDLLLAAVQAAIDQFELVRSERVLLEQTLHGSVAALVHILALAQPATFGRIDRLKRLVARLAGALAIPHRWEVEVAAMLAEIGSIGLPADLVDKLSTGAPLSDIESNLADTRTAIAARIIGPIPRLGGVREILECVGYHYEPAADRKQPRVGDTIPIGARLLTLVLDYDRLESGGVPPAEAIRILRGRKSRYDRKIVAALAAQYEQTAADTAIVEVLLTEVIPGMVFAEDVRSGDGTLLISRGQEVTPGLVSRIQNYWTDTPISGPVRVTRPATHKVPE